MTHDVNSKDISKKKNIVTTNLLFTLRYTKSPLGELSITDI